MVTVVVSMGRDGGRNGGHAQEVGAVCRRRSALGA